MKLRQRNMVIKLIGGVLFAAVFISILFVINNGTSHNKSGDSSVNYVSAKVIKIISENISPDEHAENRMAGSQEIEIIINQGVHKGETMTITNYLSALHNIHVKQGSRIIVRMSTEENGSYTTSVYSYNRTLILYLFCGLFLLTLSIIGGKKGIKAMIGLVFTIVCVIFILLPLVQNGFSPILIVIFIVILTTTLCFVLLDGVNAKTISAILATVFGVVIAGLFAIVVGGIAHMNGFNMQEAESMMLTISDSKVQISQMLTAGILVAALGAVMDIAISIASSVYEIHTVNPSMSSKELFKSGMNIGKDTMGTMSNTLILAFVGSSLNMLLLVYAYQIPFAQLINTDIIGIEVLQGISASFGLILTVPLVALISSYMVVRFHKN